MRKQMPRYTPLIVKSELQRVHFFQGFFSFKKPPKQTCNAFGSKKKNNLNQKETDGFIPYFKNN